MAKKEDKKSKPESKTPELTKAKKALDAYLKENKLDPTKDWTKDKKHGKKITELVNKLNKERDKVAAAYPEKDADNNKKLVKLKEKKEKEKKEKEKSGKKEEKKEKKSAGRTATKYDYPLIDGREMTSAEKKKYRMEQRKLASGNAPKEEKEAKKAKKEKVKEKPASDKKEKADKKKDKKKKKAAKEED